MVCLEGNVLGKLKLPVVFPLEDCFCFYLDDLGGHSCQAAQVLEGRF